jgi:hypothetical protein
MAEVKHSLKIRFFSVNAAKKFFLMWQNYLTRRWDTDQGLLCSRTQSRQSIRLFLQSSELGPPPHLQASVSPPPLVPGGGTLACGRGVGEVPVRTRGETLWYSGIYVLCAAEKCQAIH